MKKTFNKSERLASKKLIDQLFKDGHSFFNYPFKVIVFETESVGNTKELSPVQVLVSVSKRNFKNATDRNRIKRLIRESYRKNKSMLYAEGNVSDKQLLLGLIYTAKTILPSAEIESKIILILQRLIKQDEQAAG